MRYFVLILLLCSAPANAQNLALFVTTINGQSADSRDVRVVSGVLAVSTILQVPNSGIFPIRNFSHTALLGAVPVAELTISPTTFTIDTRLVPDGVHALTFRVNDGSTIYGTPHIWIVDNMPGVADLPTLPSCGGEEGVYGLVPGAQTTPNCIDTAMPPAPVKSYPHPAPLAQAHAAPASRAAYWVDFVLPNTALFKEVRRLWRTSHGEKVIMPFQAQFGANWSYAKNLVDRLPLSDGPRSTAYVSAYIVGAVHPDTQELYFVEHGAEWGRLGKISLSGTTTTLAGYRLKASAIPCFYRDAACNFAADKEKLGDFSAYPPGKFRAPLDLSFDLADHNKLYVADTDNGRVALVDLSVSPVQVTSLVAGLSVPMSVSATDGGLWIIERGTGELKKFSGGQLTTILTGLGAGLASTDYTVVVRAADHGSPRHAYIARPNGIYHFNPADGAFVLIGSVTESPTWIWIDVDPRGSTGGNQVYTAWFGSTEKYYRFDPAARTFTLLHAANYQRETRADQTAAGHYPWMIAAGAGAVWTAGTGTFGVQRMRLALPTDPPSLTFQQQDEWYNGVRVWRKGGGVAHAWGDVPGFTLSHGPHGWHYLGNTAAEDLAALSDADLNSALLGGLGTGIPRQFNSIELAQLREFVRSNSPWAIRGLLPPGEPPPPPPVCGDGNLDAGEECDDGNTIPCDGCDNVCRIEVCGNGRVECAEECDDGNVQNGDGCSAICEIETPPPPGDIPVPRATLEAWLAALESITAAIRQLLGIP